MKDLFKLIAVVLIVGIIAVAVHLVLYNIDKTKSAQLFKPTIDNVSMQSIDTSKPVNLITWNIDGGTYVADNRYENKLVTSQIVYENLRMITGILRSDDSDIILLQNVDKKSQQSAEINEVNYISNRMKSNNSVSFAYNKFNTFYTKYIPFSSRYTGLLSLSKSKANFTQTLQISSSDKIRDKAFDNIEIIQVVKYPIANSYKHLAVFNINLSRDKTLNNRQLSDIYDMITEEYEKNGNIVIVGGTWNAVLDASSIPQEATWKPNEIEKKAEYAKLFALGWTFSTDDMNANAVVYDRELDKDVYFPLDGFLCSPDVSVYRVRTIDTESRPSSHNPIMIKINVAVNTDYV